MAHRQCALCQRQEGGLGAQDRSFCGGQKGWDTRRTRSMQQLVTNLASQEIHTTEGAFPTGTREVFELKTAGGYKLTLTADHKVYTRHRGWVEARELNTNDEIKLPSKPAAVQEIGEPQDPRLFQLLGLFLSEPRIALRAGAACEGQRSDAAGEGAARHAISVHWQTP